MSMKDDLCIYPISRQAADELVCEYHYSGRPYTKSQLHLGVFWDGDLEGCLQFGPPIDRRKVLHLVKGTEWHEMCELNRMAFSDRLPRNSESRSLAVCARLFKKHAPWIKWILSFADGAQCGDGTIYRAAGWKLTGIKETDSLYRTPDGRVISNVGLRTSEALRDELSVDGTTHTAFVDAGLDPLGGYQYRYIKPLRDDLEFTCETIDYSDLPEASSGAG